MELQASCLLFSAKFPSVHLFKPKATIHIFWQYQSP